MIMAWTILKTALENGLVLASEIEVVKVDDRKGDVQVFGLDLKGRETIYHGRNLVLASGAIGNARLLLNSGFGKELPHIGKGFFCHPQFMSFGVYDEKINSHTGTFQAFKSDDVGFRKEEFKLENVYAGPAGISLLVPGFGKMHQETMEKLSHFACKGLVEELLAKAGFRPGWVQVVYGSSSKVGDALVDGKPNKIFFIGSQTVGKHVMAKTATHLIPVELELGSKDPMVVFDDVNIDRAVGGAVWGAFTTTGQSCTSVERLFIHENIYEKFKDTLIRETLKLVQATDTDGSADIGPMCTQSQVKEIAAQVADAKEKGAKFLTGQDWDSESKFIPPMIIEGVTTDMSINTEENFGPLLPLYSFSSEAQAIELTNDPEYGLSASVWSKDIKRADRIARNIYTGNVSINNVMLTEGNHALPFGGVNKSGFGRFKGEFGFYAFTNVKAILIDKDSAKMEANWFPYTTKKYNIFSDFTKAIYSPGKITGLIKGAVHGLRLETYVGKLAKKNRK